VPDPEGGFSACESIRRALISLQCWSGNEAYLAVGLRVYLASVKNASSTPSFILADVSMNLIPSSFASSRPCSSVTAFLSVQSDLLPMSILFTPSDACCSMFACQVRISKCECSNLKA
jgi:hypothetical protein